MSPVCAVRLRPGHRLQWEPAQAAHVLLYPEGMVRLNGPAGEVLARCDGRRVDALVADLQRAFPGADLADDVNEFLADARARGWIEIDGG